MLLSNKVALITGAGSGLGKAQAIEYAKEGAKVVLVDINSEGVEDTYKKIVEIDGEAMVVAGNISEKESVKQIVDQAMTKYGHIDVLVNCAAVLADFKATLEIEEDEWDKVLDTNLKGIYLLTNAVMPQMLDREKGTIINIASIGGKIAGVGDAAYIASKHGVIGYTKQLTFDYADKGIKANAICPGLVKTGMTGKAIDNDDPHVTEQVADTPMGRVGKPEEIAHLSVFLASDKSDFINGESITIDGGQSVK